MKSYQNETEFNQFILSEMPHFIAVNYQRLLDAKTPQDRVERALQIYNLMLRALTIALVSQYLIHDRDTVSDPYLNELLLQKFPRLTLDAWQELFFTTLKIYEGHQDLFFMPELYQVYWDTSELPHKRQPDGEQPFERLTQISLEIKTAQLLPQGATGWEQLTEETTRLLQQVLQKLAFIGKYDLIRVLEYHEHAYTFQLHKGLTVTVGTQPLTKQNDLNCGWFYLRKETEEFLLLHPLFVFWEGEPLENGLIPADIGVYDRFVYERLQYMLTTLGRTIVDNKSVAGFVTLLYDTIEEAKRKRQEAERLTWWQLRTICADITRHRMTTVQGKYNAKLYLQREKTRQAFEQFLNEKEKKCFILIGKSGVGKSNFILSVGEEFQHAHNDHWCVLMYDGANLTVEPSVTTAISQDFNDRLKLSGRRIEDVWGEIAHIDGIAERGLILYMDAINENPQAKELLRQIDALVQKPYPWLKVVISSRPETWQTIKRGVKLAENLYYREEGTETIGVEMEPFSYSEQMEPFSRHELPVAYAKYQQTFNLQTAYEVLRSDLRELLRDPLSLWLVAKTYQGKAIPETLKSTELIEQYVHALLQSERLSGKDLRLLETQLVPLMLSAGHYSNTITVADTDTAEGGLSERIYSEQRLSDGRQVNQAFINLLDADILVRQGEGRNQKIGFKYERFYEYFVGKRLFELSASQTDKSRFFTEIINQVNTVPFLWGAIKNALIQDLKTHGFQTVRSLCFTDQQRVKEMMINVLTDFGREHAAEVERVLESILPSKERLSTFKSILGLLGKIPIRSTVRTRNAQTIAIETASHLNVPRVLQTAALHVDPSIRTAAVRAIYHLWQRDQQAGLAVLQLLTDRVTRHWIPHVSGFETLYGLSLVIFFDHPHDPVVNEHLRNVWRKIIERLLFLRESRSLWKDSVRNFFRQRLLNMAITLSLRVLQEFPRYSALNDVHELDRAFHSTQSEKDLYRRLVRYIDIHEDYAREQMKNDFLVTFKIKNTLIQSIGCLGLSVHAMQETEQFLPLLKIFFEEAQQCPVSNIYVNYIPETLRGVLFRNPMRNEIYTFFLRALEILPQYYAEHPYAACLAPEADFLGPLMFISYQRTGSIKISLIEERIHTAIKTKHIQFFDLLIKSELSLIGFELKQPQIALDGLGLFFKQRIPEIEPLIQMFLARMRVYYPDDVEDFLEGQDAPESFRLQVRNTEVTETIGELIGWRSWHFLRDLCCEASSPVFFRLVKVLGYAAECKNLQVWVRYFLSELINVTCGVEILRPTK